MKKEDKSNTYNSFSSNISFFLVKERNITTKPVVSFRFIPFFKLFLSSCQIHENLPFLSVSVSLSLSLYIYIYKQDLALHNTQ